MQILGDEEVCGLTMGYLGSGCQGLTSGKCHVWVFVPGREKRRRGIGCPAHTSALVGRSPVYAAGRGALHRAGTVMHWLWSLSIKQSRPLHRTTMLGCSLSNRPLVIRCSPTALSILSSPSGVKKER